MPPAVALGPVPPAPLVRPAARPTAGPELADIFRLHGEDYRRAHRMPLEHHRVMRHIERCRTAPMGGRRERCEACGFQQIIYNSCRDRHCPKCQATARAGWVEARRAELLPVPYFHVVFTLPHELNPIAEVMHNKAPIYNLLFGAASETLKAFGENPENGLGGKMGFTALLHTWDQKLRTHIHLHCVVPGGALSFDKGEWLSLRREDFLFPVRALSRVFRGKFMEGLRRAFQEGQLAFPSPVAHFRAPGEREALISSLYRTEWVVYAKPPFRGSEQVLDYLARYTHRVAISNHRIRKLAGAEVTFTYRDRAAGNVLRECTLSAEEFIRRFLLHVLPRGFMRIRHFGLLANRAKATDLPICRRLLGLSAEIQTPEPLDARETLLRLKGVDIALCPECGGGTMQTIQILHPPRFSVRRASRRRAPPC